MNPEHPMHTELYLLLPEIRFCRSRLGPAAARPPSPVWGGCLIRLPLYHLSFDQQCGRHTVHQPGREYDLIPLNSPCRSLETRIQAFALHLLEPTYWVSSRGSDSGSFKDSSASTSARACRATARANPFNILQLSDIQIHATRRRYFLHGMLDRLSHPEPKRQPGQQPCAFYLLLISFFDFGGRLTNPVLGSRIP